MNIPCHLLFENNCFQMFVSQVVHSEGSFFNDAFEYKDRNLSNNVTNVGFQGINSSEKQSEGLIS